MPTQVRPDDPNATGAARLQSMVAGGREPGTPSMAGKPGVQAGRTSFPAPPAPATGGLPGRPAQPKPQPGTPAAGAGPSSAAPPQAAAAPPQPGSPQPASAAGSQTTQGTGKPGEGAPAAPPPPSLDAAGGMATQTFTSPTIPRNGPLTAGTQVQTPYGAVSASPDGRKLALDANGAQKYKETMAALRGKFAVPKVMKGMTGLPEMELKLGASNFDPFSGRYHGRE